MVWEIAAAMGVVGVKWRWCGHDHSSGAVVLEESIKIEMVVVVVVVVTDSGPYLVKKLDILLGLP